MMTIRGIDIGLASEIQLPLPRDAMVLSAEIVIRANGQPIPRLFYRTRGVTETRLRRVLLVGEDDPREGLAHFQYLGPVTLNPDRPRSWLHVFVEV